MRAAILTPADGAVAVEQVSTAELKPQDVRLQIEASGVCHSDLSTIRGMLPSAELSAIVLGHEAAGTVLEVGSAVTRCTVGDRVIFSWWPQCGSCWYCLRGAATQCEFAAQLRADRSYSVIRSAGDRAYTLGMGAFAEEMIAHEFCAVPVESDLPSTQLALIGCGVTTGVGAVLWTAGVEPGSSVAVFGCGGVGQFAVQGARVAGATTIVAVDPVALKRDTAIQMGATHALDPSDGTAVEQLHELTNGRGVDYAFEVVGLPQVIQDAFLATRARGTVVAVGVPRAGSQVTFPADVLLAREKRILGSFYGSSVARVHFPLILQMVAAGQIDVASSISRQLHLGDVMEAFRAMEAGEVIRSVIVPG